MMKEEVHRLHHLIFFFLILVVSSAGCAHRQVANSTSGSRDASFQNNPATSPSAFDQAQSKQGKVERGALESELDVFSDDGTEEEVARVADPLQHWNRAMFHVNDKLYFWVLKPVSRGYKAVIPTPVRSGVRNFFHNLTTPVRLASALLQGKGRKASAELTSFLINSTVGVLGFGNPANRWPELSPSEEDLGQTLATYGIGDGFYLVWPVLGPSTLRDSVGMVGDWLLNPVFYVEPTEASLGIWAYDFLNDTSFRIGEYESMKDAAIDPYIALRNIYIQNRKKKEKE
jgi:phospholipid-binding lipoprotein MlaA